MQKVQKTYTPEFKQEAVRLAQTSGKPIAQVARELPHWAWTGLKGTISGRILRRSNLWGVWQP